MNFIEFIGILILFGGAGLGIYNSRGAKKTSSSTSSLEGKYLCVPCGFIYDPALGDTDSGIQAGTRFEDIPDDWRCPVCGVTKSDFIPLGSVQKDTSFDTQVLEHRFINQSGNVLLLKVKTQKDIAVRAGQYFSFIYTDSQGEFRRNYSLVEKQGTTYTFLIRIEENSRSGVLLKEKKVGDTMRVFGVFGNFAYRDTPNRKVFIATGTGLAPLYSMIQSHPREDHVLIFGGKNQEDMFYMEEIQKLPLLQHICIYLSRQESLPANTATCQFTGGRLDLGLFLDTHPEYTHPDTEFYLCGNPKLVDSCIEFLESRSYPNIICEKF